MRSVIVPKLLATGKTIEEIQTNQQLLIDAVLAEIKDMTLMDLYEANGYVFTEGLPSVKPVRGSLCMAMRAPTPTATNFY